MHTRTVLPVEEPSLEGMEGWERVVMSYPQLSGAAGRNGECQSPRGRFPETHWLSMESGNLGTAGEWLPHDRSEGNHLYTTYVGGVREEGLEGG